MREEGVKAPDAMRPEPPPPPPPAPPKKCPQCGYLLRGLPAQGRCPECGWAYDANVLVLYGQPLGRATRGPAMTASRGTWFYATLLLSVGLGGALWVVSNLLLGVIGAGAIGLFGVAAYYGARTIDARRERTQLRLTPAGAGLRDKPGDVKFKPWDTIGLVRIAWEPEPTPGWVTVALVGTEKQRKRRRWVRVLGLVPAADALRPEQLAGIEAELDAASARALIETLGAWIPAGGGELELSNPTRERLGLPDEVAGEEATADDRRGEARPT